MMRGITRTMVTAAVLLLTAGGAGGAQAAKAYNDPWLEGDLQQMRVPSALDILARTPQPVTVAVVDSGVRLDDPDLAPHLLRMPSAYTCSDEYGPGPSYAANPANGDFGCDFIGSGTDAGPTTVPDGSPSDPFGHGTGATAIIAAVPNNGVGGAGVAPNARVLPVRACYGGNPDCYGEPALAALTYAYAMGATIVNASWPPGNDYSSDFRAFIASHRSMLFVFAIGGTDQNDDPYTLCTNKATFPNVICVGLANADDSAGTVNADSSTDVSAPGNAGVPSITGTRAGFGYTSGATAHVSGAAAVLRGLAPTMSSSTIRTVLTTTSRQVAGYETANKAKGIVDLEAAVREVQRLQGLTTPAAGQGAPADTPDPFAGSVALLPTPTPAAALPAATPTPTPGSKPATPLTAGLTLSAPPKTIRAGSTLTLRLRLTAKNTGTVTATLKHGKSTLAKATKKRAKGSVKLALRLPRTARRGSAVLTVRLADRKPVMRTITVNRPR
ncbi:MAG: S8 family serine peptidase [Solirubrobacteraceae bacterium]|nr:S8 family serine peptidase [Solirubrobacteraceae bacterium]